MKLYLTLAPFILAIVMGLLAPELSGSVRDRVVTLMREASNRTAPGPHTPPHASPEYVGDYVEYAADVAQTIPSLLLPLVGAVLVLEGDRLSVSTTTLLVVVVPGCLFIFLRMLKLDPISYVARKYIRARYTLLPLAAVIMNIAAVMIILGFHAWG